MGESLLNVQDLRVDYEATTAATETQKALARVTPVHFLAALLHT